MYSQRPPPLPATAHVLYFTPPPLLPPPLPPFHHSPPPLPRGNFHIPTQVIRQQQYHYHMERQRQQQQHRQQPLLRRVSSYRQTRTGSFSKHVSGNQITSPQSISDPRQPPFSLMGGFKMATSW